MSGIIDLNEILRNLNPSVHEGEYVFVSLQNLSGLSMQQVVACIREPEGHSVILPRAYAEQEGFAFSFTAEWITINVHTALEAPGFSACFSSALESSGISVNVVAGYYHDHLFVPAGTSDQCLTVLQKLRESAT